jgi:ribosomal protein S5
MFKVEVIKTEDANFMNKGWVTGRGHGMAKTVHKAKKEAFRMANAQLCRLTEGWGAACVLEQVTITEIGTGKVTVEW